MKKIFKLFIVLFSIIGFSACTDEDQQMAELKNREHYWNQHVNENIMKVEYEDHTYLLWKVKRMRGWGFTHDMNCKCMKK